MCALIQFFDRTKQQWEQSMPVANDTYVRPFGPNAPWNIAVADLPLAENSEELASQLWNDSYTDRELRNFNINNTSYTYPVYEVTEDTPYFPVVDKNGWGNLGGKEIPFDPSWKPAPGSDAQIIILDPATGREWNLWQAEFDGDSVNVSNGNLVPGSYFEKEDGFSSSRGVGIQYSAMLVRPEEVAQGVIEHALSMPIRNTSGSEFVAPGTKLEFPGVRPDGIPEGTRFALDVTDEQIDAHLASLPDSVPDVTKASLKTIMVAMKDYGWFITDTAGSAHIQLESTTTAQEEWEALGMIDKDSGGSVYPRDALDGLITQSRIVAFVPSDEYPRQLEVAATTADAPVTLDVLDNDSDPDEMLSTTGVSDVAGGTVEMQGDAFVFTPAAEFTGGDGFGVADTAPVSLDVGAPRPALMLGSAGNDRVTGTMADEIIDTLDGRRDVMAGGGGADTFRFSATANGQRDTRTVLDFGADDGLDLGTASVATWREIDSDMYLYLDQDRDVVILKGVAGYDPDNFA
jgi:hypothetical protein